jgi:hypothetical protein
MASHRKLAVVLAALALSAPVPFAAAPGDEAHAHAGAITMSRGGETSATTVLGALLGSDRVSGIKVDLYALQATAPERLAPTGTGPTHVFNATFVDEAESRLLVAAGGTMVVDGPGGERRAEIVPFARHFQSAVRLDEPGDYRIRVEFRTEGRSGTTRPFAFHYERKPDGGHVHHGGAGS